MAVLFALDRADARDEIDRLRAAHDVVILDRYVASNAAYSAARLHQDVDGEVVAWVRELEFDRFGLPHPRLAGAARGADRVGRPQRAERRAETEADRARDAYERDDGLQRRTSAAYAALAAAQLGRTVGRRRTRRRSPQNSAANSRLPDLRAKRPVW